MKARLLVVAVTLLVLSNLVTGWKLYSSMQIAEEQSRRDADMAIGQIHEAVSDLQPVTSPVDADETDRVLRAAQKLQIAYQSLYGLELRNELPVNEPRWSQVVNVIRGPLTAMVAARDYSGLPTVKQRLHEITGLVPLPPDSREALPKLWEAHKRLGDAFKP